MNQDSRGVVSWLWEFAYPHKGGYIASLIFATSGVACSMVPYFLVAQIVLALLRGETDMGIYGFTACLPQDFGCCGICSMVFPRRFLINPPLQCSQRCV
jgi:ATP-binding cassette subfamily B protein